MAYDPIHPLLPNGSVFTRDHIAHIENGILGAVSEARGYVDEVAASIEAGEVSDAALDSAITRAVDEGRIAVDPVDLTITEAQEGVYQIADGTGEILGLTTGKTLPAAAKTDLALTFPTKTALDGAVAGHVGDAASSTSAALKSVRGVVEEREARTASALARVGNKIGTSGRGVVMLRFDDYPDDFVSKVVPVLQKYDLPAYFAVTQNHVENLSSVSWAQLNSIAVQDGVQMTGHSWSHGNATTTEGIIQEIVGSADYFEAQMPSTRIDVWTQPSVGSGVTPYNDYDGNSDAEFYNTFAGRLLLSRYTVINGARKGFYHAQGHHNAIGTANLTYEGHTLSGFQGYVRQVADGGYAADFMCHPGRLDTAGYMTSATFDECMGYLAQLRDEGLLMVVTGLAKAVLDGGSDYRHNLLPGSFAGGQQGWLASGYTLTGGFYRSPATTAPLTYAFVPARVTGSYGSVREFHAVVRSTSANTIRLRAYGDNATFEVSKDFTVPGDGQWHEIRKFLTIPYDTAETYIRFAVSSTTGVSYDVQQVNAFAV